MNKLRNSKQTPVIYLLLLIFAGISIAAFILQITSKKKNCRESYTDLEIEDYPECPAGEWQCDADKDTHCHVGTGDWFYCDACFDEGTSKEVFGGSGRWIAGDGGGGTYGCCALAMESGYDYGLNNDITGCPIKLDKDDCPGWNQNINDDKYTDSQLCWDKDNDKLYKLNNCNWGAASQAKFGGDARWIEINKKNAMPEPAGVPAAGYAGCCCNDVNCLTYDNWCP